MTNFGETVNVSALTRENGQSSHKTDQLHDPLLSDETRGVLEILFYAALGGSIGVVGSAVNVINIIIFARQGFSDSVNVSLCALAVSDLGFLLPMVWISICSNPLFQYSDITFDSVEIHYITGGMPHSCFVRTTSLITAFITFERCVCIALPMKVKSIITPKRTLMTIVAMFLVIFATNSPVFSSIYFAPSFHANRNLTLVGLVYTNNTKVFEEVSLSLNATVQVSSFISVIICTIILVVKLKAKSEWRQNAISGSGVSDSISARDKRVMKMVTSISSIYIISYFPSAINLMLMVYWSPQYSATGQYENLYLVSWSIINSIEGINSSVSILIYYRMSSKFRETFRCILFFHKHKLIF